MDRRGPALSSDARAFGLRRQVVPTPLGRIVVRSRVDSGEVATILLHGAAGSWTTWTPLLRAARDSGAPLRDVIAIDLPGWGDSTASASRLDIAQTSATVAAVAHALGYSRWVAVGHSLGGFLALDIAARYATHTAALLLVSPSGPAVIDAVRHPVRALRTLPGFVGMLLAMRALAALGAAGRGFVRGLHRAGILRPLSAPLFADPARVHHSVIDALSHEIRPRAFVEAARAAAAYDVSIWRDIVCPVRSVRGERDVFVADSDETDLAALVEDFEQVTVRGAGHFAAVERPDAVLQSFRRLAPAAPVEGDSGMPSRLH